jgi:sugar lactone lactonase YvrE
MGIAITAEGCMVICDSKNRSVKRISKDGVVETIVSNLKSLPLEIVEDTDGTFVITTQHGLVRCIPPEQRKSDEDPSHKLVAGLWGTSGCNIGMAAEARFRNPESIAMHPSGALLVSDSNNNYIRKVQFDRELSAGSKQLLTYSTWSSLAKTALYQQRREMENRLD